MPKKILPEATMQRESVSPYRWVLTDDETGKVIDIDKYQNDLKPRWENQYKITKIGL